LHWCAAQVGPGAADGLCETIGQTDTVQARINEVLEDQARMAELLERSA
jgi:hypothetical protein